MSKTDDAIFFSGEVEEPIDEILDRIEAKIDRLPSKAFWVLICFVLPLFFAFGLFLYEQSAV